MKLIRYLHRYVNHNTAKALKAAREGAEAVGAETEIVNLFRIEDLEKARALDKRLVEEAVADKESE